MLKRLRVLALLAATALAGCASVDATDIQKFGVATAAVAQAARDAGTLNDDMTYTIRLEDHAGRFATGGVHYEFPPPHRDRSRISTAWDVQVAYANALVAYADALTKSAAGVSGTDIGTAVDNLKSAAAKAAPTAFAHPVSSQVANASVIIAKQAISWAAWQQIRAAMQRAQPAIVQGNALLATDFGKMGHAIDERYKDWLMMKQRVLDSIRANGSARERYDAYRAFASEQQALAKSLALLTSVQGGDEPGYVAVLNKMAAAHKALAEGQQDASTLAEFLAAAQQFQALAQIFAANGDT
ncbi:hypothetical protein ACIQUB_01480 [Rhizobium sp. NPDC090275]|uniref:hypothetical protein n=1 Tax=Rhizobium sp. NPDC090275 TaxID=3364498 RepID=UPI000DE0958C